MKKLALFFGLLFLVASGTNAMSIKDDSSAEENEISLSAEDTAKPDYFDKQLKKAIRYYFNGDLDKAENICDKVVISNPENEAAVELQNKIAFLKQKEVLYNQQLVDSYYIELRKAVMEGNCYEGFMYLNRIGKISQDEKMNYFSNVLAMEKENILSRFDNNSDKKTFLKSLNAFIKGDFVSSTKLLYKLQEKYPQFSIYLSISRAKEFQEGNDNRAKDLYRKTIRSLKKNDFVAAKNHAELLYMMDYGNVKARLLLEQIELEIED